jgi:hypothetical protein
MSQYTRTLVESIQVSSVATCGETVTYLRALMFTHVVTWHVLLLTQCVPVSIQSRAKLPERCFLSSGQSAILHGASLDLSRSDHPVNSKLKSIRNEADVVLLVLLSRCRSDGTENPNINPLSPNPGPSEHRAGILALECTYRLLLLTSLHLLTSGAD